MYTNKSESINGFNVCAIVLQPPYSHVINHL